MSAPAYRLAATPRSSQRMRSVDGPTRWHAAPTEEDTHRALCGAVVRRLEAPFDPAAPDACPDCRRIAEAST